MPIKQASWKSLRQSRVHAERNRLRKKTLKLTVKTALSAIATKDKDVAEKLKKAVSQIDRATKKGLIKKNAASRKKSRLMKKLAAMKK